MCPAETCGLGLALAPGGGRTVTRPAPGRWRSRRCVCLAVPVLIGGVGAGCIERPSPAIRSQVVDARTGQPIAWAVVLGVWQKVSGGIPGMPNYKVAKLQEAETDAEGRFELQPPPRPFAKESVTVYKFGYVAWNNMFTFPSSPLKKDTRVPPELFLIPFPPGESRQRHVSFIRDSVHLPAGAHFAPKLWAAFSPEEALERDEPFPRGGSRP